MVWSQPAETSVCHHFSSHRLFPCISFSYPITSLVSFSPQQDFLPVLLHNSHFPGRWLGNLPASTATGSALLTAETGAPKVLPMPQAKRVPLAMSLGWQCSRCSSGTGSSLFALAWHQQSSLHAGRVCKFLFYPIASGEVLDTLNLVWLLYLSRVSRGEEKSRTGSEVSPLGEVRSEILGF